MEPPSEQQIIRELLSGRHVPFPLSIERAREEAAWGSPGGVADVIVTLRWGEVQERFAVEIKRRSTPLEIERARQVVERSPRYEAGPHPMIVAPYLSDEVLDGLIGKGISGIDLSGNHAIVVPGRWLVIARGNANRYPTSRPIKNVYTGRSGLVGRIFLTLPRFEQLSHVRDAILERGGEISLGTVSKVVRAMEEDVILAREDGIRLIQPERLLERLVEHYRPPRVSATRAGWSEQPVEALRSIVAAEGVRVAGCSPDHYVVAPRAYPQVEIYVSELGNWLSDVPLDQDARHPNVTLIETEDIQPFFNRHMVDGIPWCSKLEVYLSLMRGGERDRRVASQLVDEILPFYSLPRRNEEGR